MAAEQVRRFSDGPNTRQALKDVGEWEGKGEKARTAGNLYTVDLPDEHIAKMLDWDKPLSEQPAGVREALRKIGFVDDKGVTPDFATYHANPSGDDIVRRLQEKLGEVEASSILRSQGIPGIKYLDAGSRSTKEGTRNFVIFDPDIAKIMKRD